MRLLTRSLRGIHGTAHVNNMADLATKLSNIPPTLLRDFLSPEEEDTLFLNDLEEELAFSSVTSIFSRRKLVRSIYGWTSPAGQFLQMVSALSTRSLPAWFHCYHIKSNRLSLKKRLIHISFWRSVSERQKRF